MPLQQMTEQNSYDTNDNLVDSNESANELRELYDLPMISKEEFEDRMSLHIIINLNGFLKDCATNSEVSPIDVIKA